jgi:hypothetical protein
VHLCGACHIGLGMHFEIVDEAARGLPPGEHDPLDDGMPGG